MLKFRLTPAEQRPTNIVDPSQSAANNGRPTFISPSAPANNAPFASTESPAPSNPSDAADDWSVKIPELLEFFPKRLRNRARLILMTIRNRVKMNEDNRVVYKTDDGSEFQGSSIIALIHYLITPLPPNKRQTRPFDLMDFVRIIHESAIPSNAYGNGKKAIVDALIGKKEATAEATAAERIDEKNRTDNRNDTAKWIYL